MISGKRLGEITPSDFDEIFHTNTLAPLRMVQACLPQLRHPARIVNISFVAARAAYEGTGLYSASKAALEGFTRNWAAELGHYGTTVNAANPGSGQDGDAGESRQGARRAAIASYAGGVTGGNCGGDCRNLSILGGREKQLDRRAVYLGVGWVCRVLTL